MASILQNVGGQLLVCGVVFHQQNAQLGAGRRGHSDRGFDVGREFLRQWQADSEVERASLSHFTFDPDAPAHHLHEALADGESEARASKTPRHGSIGLGEGLEETIQAGRRDADSRVSHGKLQAGFAVLRQGANTDLNFAALGELDGVSGQIEQDLLQSHPVAHDRIRRLLGHTAVEAQPILACPHGKDSRNLVQHPPQAEGGRFQFQFARLDLGGVQQVVQKRQEQVGRSLGSLQAVLDRRVQSPSAVPRRSCPESRSSACAVRGSCWPGTGSWRRWRPRRQPWLVASASSACLRSLISVQVPNHF